MEIKTITNINEYTPITKEEAEKAFYNAKDIFLQVTSNQMVVSNAKRDIFFQFEKTENGKFFIKKEFDESCLIVSQYKNIQRFFQEVEGINAKVLEKVKPADVKGKIIYGTVPFSLMSQCESINVLVCEASDKNIDEMTFDEFKNSVIELKECKVEAKVVKTYRPKNTKTSVKPVKVEKYNYTRPKNNRKNYGK